MGMYWQGYKTEFEKIDYLNTRISEVDFWSELLVHCEKIDINIKSNDLVENTTPIEYGTKFMLANEKWFYNTFFYFTNWLTFDKEDERFIDKTKYTTNSNCDDLDWLRFDEELYFRAFNTKTLKQIIEDFEKVDFDFIQEKFFLERIESQKEFSIYQGFNISSYQKESKKTFSNFIELTNLIISIYSNCVSEKKDLIICFD